MRAKKIAAVALAAVIAVAALLLLIGIPAGFLTSTIQQRVERETGYRLTISGGTKISLWPSLNVKLNEIALEKSQDREASANFSVDSIQADIALRSLWSGHPHVTELVIIRPVVSMPLLRERTRAIGAPPKSAAPSGDADANAISIDRVKISNGAIVSFNLRDRVEHRIEGINVDVTIGGDREIKASGGMGKDADLLKFEATAKVPAAPIERQNIPVEFTLDAPGLLQAPLSSKAEVRLNGSLVMINGVTGTLGNDAFNGWASIDASSKPLVKLDLDFQRLDLAKPKAAAVSGSPGAGPAPSQGWSDAPITLTALNYVDAQARISAAEINIGEAKFAPVAIEATLAGGVLKCNFPNLAAYGGQVSGQLMVDATSSGNPGYALSADLSGVRALPLLHAAGFDKLDGRMQAKISLQSAGNNQRAIMSNLGGTVFANLQDGSIRGLNVAQMIRSLTSGTLSGWQGSPEQSTDLSQLSASFRIERGQATTNDLMLIGPLVKMTGAGTVDVATKSLALRVEPKLVMTTAGQGRASDPVGLGIPVVIEGPWAAPRIYPDMAGILDNPDAAYGRLKEMGKGLFGPGGALNGLGAGLSSGLSGSGGNGSPPGGANPNGANADPLGRLGETIGNLLQQGMNRPRNLPAPGASSAPAAPSASATSPSPALAQPDPTAPDSQPMNDVLRRLFNR